MSDKTPILEVRNKFGELYVARDGITVLTEGDPCDAGLIHGIVRAWNALALAGLTPEALAADQECVKKLVVVARAAAVDWSWQRSENHPMYQEHNCDRGRNPKDGEEPREECPGCYRFSMAKWSEDILHACGIKT